MGMSKNINTYYDVKEILDLVCDTITRGSPLRFRCGSPGAAQNWMQRAYTFRKLAQALEQEKILVPGIQVGTKYDSLTFKRQGNEVIISLRRPLGRLLTEEGDEITKENSSPDDLIDAAKNLMKDLDLE